MKNFDPCTLIPGTPMNGVCHGCGHALVAHIIDRSHTKYGVCSVCEVVSLITSEVLEIQT